MNNTKYSFTVRDTYASDKLLDLQKQFFAALHYKQASNQAFLADRIRDQINKDCTLFALMEAMPKQVEKPIYDYLDFIDEVTATKNFSMIGRCPERFTKLYNACYNEITSWQAWLHCNEEYKYKDFEEMIEVIREYRLILDTALDSVISNNIQPLA